MTRSDRSRPRAVAAAAIAALGGAAALHLTPFSPPSTALAQARAESPVPSFADAVERTMPAVVNIAVTKTFGTGAGFSRDLRPFPGRPLDEFFGRFFEPPAVPGAPRRAEGAGSGFIIDPEGYVVTNHHVVAAADEIRVTLADGRQLDATIVGDDPQMDLALLKLDVGERLPHVELADSDAVRVGDWVIAIGNPFGLGGSVSVGVVSARGRDIRTGPYDDYLQIDAPINRGNSGGPVLNAEGFVIGVSTAIVSPNGGNVGIGFAIPSNRAASVVRQLKEKGSVERGWLGVELQRLDPSLARSLGLEAPKGALIARVLPNGPAARAGLEAGDVVIRFGNREIGSSRDLTFAVAETAPGERVAVRVIRDGAERTLDVELGQRAEDGRGYAPQARPGRAAEAPLGLRLAPLTASERARLGLPAEVVGALVASVRPGSPAARHGLRPGDVIVEIDRERVESADEAAAALERARGESVLLLVRRGDTQLFVAVD